jgi:hypothetical protein
MLVPTGLCAVDMEGRTGHNYLDARPYYDAYGQPSGTKWRKRYDHIMANAAQKDKFTKYKVLPACMLTVSGVRMCWCTFAPRMLCDAMQFEPIVRASVSPFYSFYPAVSHEPQGQYRTLLTSSRMYHRRTLVTSRGSSAPSSLMSSAI